MVKVPPPPCVPRPTKEELPPVLSARSNVFDDDEFDVFHRDQVDMSRIWKGRRWVKKYTQYNPLLNAAIHPYYLVGIYLVRQHPTLISCAKSSQDSKPFVCAAAYIIGSLGPLIIPLGAQ